MWAGCEADGVFLTLGSVKERIHEDSVREEEFQVDFVRQRERRLFLYRLLDVKEEI